MALTQGILGINNLSLTDGYTIDFEVDWSYFVDANVTDSDLEYTTAISESVLESSLYSSLLELAMSSDSDEEGGLFIDNDIIPTFSNYEI